MAFSRSLFASLLLFSLLAIVSANSSYDNYDQDTKYVDDNHNYDHHHTMIPVDELHKKLEKLIRHSYPAQHGHQSEQGYQHSSQEDVKPTVPEGHENLPAETSYVQKPESDNDHDYQSEQGSQEDVKPAVPEGHENLPEETSDVEKPESVNHDYQSEQGLQEDVKPAVPEGHENIPTETSYVQKPESDNRDYQSEQGSQEDVKPAVPEGHDNLPEETSDEQKPDQSEQGSQEDVKPAVPEGHENIPTETSYVQKPESDNRDYQSEQGSQEDVKPVVPEGHDNLPEETSDVQKPERGNHDYQSHEGVNYIEFRGTILCKSGVSSYTAISGAIAKITCPGWNENGYEYAPFSISSVTDKHGFYYATYPVSKLPKNDWTRLVKACQVIPEYSPMGICNLPVPNGGSHGAYVAYSRIVGDKAYYNAGSLFYTPAESSRNYPKQSTNIPKDASLPAGGGY